MCPLNRNSVPTQSPWRDCSLLIGPEAQLYRPEVVKNYGHQGKTSTLSEQAAKVRHGFQANIFHIGLRVIFPTQNVKLVEEIAEGGTISPRLPESCNGRAYVLFRKSGFYFIKNEGKTKKSWFGASSGIFHYSRLRFLVLQVSPVINNSGAK
jgi:hypothetical protein